MHLTINTLLPVAKVIYRNLHIDFSISESHHPPPRKYPILKKKKSIIEFNMVTDLLTYSNIPGRRDSLSVKASISIGSGFTKYPMSGRNLTGRLLPLQNNASFRGNR
jgi:hypothetical protein